VTNVIRLVLAAVMLAGVYVVAAVVALFTLGFIALPFVLVAFMGNSPLLAPLNFLAVAVGLPGMLAIGRGLQVIRHIGDPWPSVELPEAGTEPLRLVIADIAARSGTAAPSDLRLAPVANAGVTERIRLLGPRGGVRTLYIGLPFLVGLSAGQLTAVLGHEMGHYAGGHARPSILVHRGMVTLAGIRAAFRLLSTAAPTTNQAVVIRPLAVVASWFLVGYATVGYGAFTAYEFAYQRLGFAMRRVQEYEADDCAQRIVGAEELAGALRRIEAVAAAWRDFQARFLGPLRRAGCVPDDVFEAFGAMLADAGYREVMQAGEREQGQRVTSPSDTHPCLTDRLARLVERAARQAPAEAGGRAAPLAGAVLGGRPATALIPVLADRPWSAELSDKTKPPGQLASLPWDACLRRIGQADAIARAGDLLRAIRAVRRGPGPVGEPVGTGGTGGTGGTEMVTLLDVLRTIERSRGELAAALAPSAAGAGDASLVGLSAGLTALISFLVVDSGCASWQVSWRDGLLAGGLTLAPWDVTDTATEQLSARVNSFVDNPGDAAHESAIVGHLRSLQIDPGQPVSLTTEPTTRQASGAGSASGDTVVIRPAATGRRDRLPVRASTAIVLAAGVLALGILGVVIVNRPEGQATPLTADSAFEPTAPDYLPSYDPDPIVLRTPDLLVPSYILPTYALPTAFLAMAKCPPPLGSDARCTTVTVERGQTLSLLACRYRTSVAVVQELNNLGASTTIDAGDKLTVPVPENGQAACG